MELCECGSNKFRADIISGDQKIMIGENGEILECETTVYVTSPLCCAECGKNA